MHRYANELLFDLAYLLHSLDGLRFAPPHPADTILSSKTLPIGLIPQRLARFQRMLDSCLRFFRRQQFYKRASFQFEEPVFIDQAAGSQVATAHHIRKLASNVMVVLRDVVTFLEHPRADAQASQRIAAKIGRAHV